MKRALTPRDIAAKKWKTLPWNERWSKPFGFPAENASWFNSRLTYTATIGDHVFYA